MDAQMKKGVVEMCILHLIQSEQRYGYEIMQLVNKAFPDINESTIYAILRRLNKEGAAKVTLGTVSGGPPRKYYFITEQGREALAGAKSNWRGLIASVAALGIE